MAEGVLVPSFVCPQCLLAKAPCTRLVWVSVPAGPPFCPIPAQLLCGSQSVHASVSNSGGFLALAFKSDLLRERWVNYWFTRLMFAEFSTLCGSFSFQPWSYSCEQRTKGYIRAGHT